MLKVKENTKKEDKKDVERNKDKKKLKKKRNGWWLPINDYFWVSWLNFIRW